LKGIIFSNLLNVLQKFVLVLFSSFELEMCIVVFKVR
jgi:hypothetical protein